MRKGQFGTLKKILFALAAVTFIYIIVQPHFFGKDSILQKGVGFLTETAEEATNGTVSRENVECGGDYTTQELGSAIRSEAQQTQGSGAPVPAELALAVAEVESDMRHCENGYVIQSQPGEEGNSVGLMQVNVDTANSNCPDMDVYKLEDNIACGIKVLQAKYRLVEDDEKYEDLVNEYCKATKSPQMNDKYLGYTDNWNQALRAYNGFGCTEGADTDYVETVRGEME